MARKLFLLDRGARFSGTEGNGTPSPRGGCPANWTCERIAVVLQLEGVWLEGGVTIDKFGRANGGPPKRAGDDQSGVFEASPIAGEVGGGGGMPNSRIRRFTTTV